MKKTIVLCTAALTALALASGLYAEGGVGRGPVNPRGMFRWPGSWTSTYENPFHDYVLPLMMDLSSVADQYLQYSKEIGLTADQVKALKDLRNSYQSQILSLDSELNVELMNLHDLMMEDDVDMMLIQSENQRVESLQSEIRIKNFNLFYSARRVLTKDQTKKAGELGIKQSPWEYYGYDWAVDY